MARPLACRKPGAAVFLRFRLMPCSLDAPRQPFSDDQPMARLLSRSPQPAAKLSKSEHYEHYACVPSHMVVFIACDGAHNTKRRSLHHCDKRFPSKQSLMRRQRANHALRQRMDG